MNFTCDVCGREVFSCTFVNGMKFCAKCYQETFGETDKDRKIAVLETKLVEKEKERELDNSFWKQECDSLQKQLAESEKSKESYRLQNEQHHLQLLQFYSRLGVEAFGADIHEKALETLMIMKEQLAEKEKEIEELKLKLDIRAISLQNFNIERMQANQDKISFAVEQLEQLKKLCQEKFNWWENSEWEGNIYDKSDVSNAYFDIEANVDNQIEELKKEMK